MCPRNTLRAGTHGNEVFIRLYHREIQNGSSGAVLEAAELRLLCFVQKNQKPRGEPHQKRDKLSPEQPGVASALPYGPAPRAHKPGKQRKQMKPA